ncbi:hemerythrin domain-containing protein [Porphyromonas gingivicanis]|uniref:hemerythrin domain-containing protein n=1 Tax=Porphyromonas gingivicanis TaxID=266762 RepID=UPI00046FD3F2|nr:hemerythrin domain-containing protein [Porphyromonas gingivicanis]
MNKNKVYRYTADTLMSDLICDHYDLLLVITRFGIALGCGEQSIREVCDKHNVHTPTLLAVINAVANHVTSVEKSDLEQLSPLALIDYLKRSHHYFLDYRLPLIREQLHKAIEGGPRDIVLLINRFFDEYVDEVHKHMGYEDKTVFPYVTKLVNQSEDLSNYHIDIFSKRHDKIEAKISELKNILIKYYPGDSGYGLTAVLHEIFSTEEDLATHNFIEDNLFVPLIRKMEINNA